MVDIRQSPAARLRLPALILALLFAVLAGQARAAALSASVDRTDLAQGESLTLTLLYGGQVLGDPDFSDLSRDFDIINSQRQSHLSLGGGGRQSSTEWRLTLMPLRAGRLVIPSFHFRGEVSDAVPINVSDQPPSADQTRPLFVETELESPRAHVGEQVLLSLKVHSALPLASLSAPELEVANAQVVRVHESQYQRTIGGTTYAVIEVKYALFPQSAGRLSIPALRFTGEVPDRNDPFRAFGGSLFGQGRKQVVVASDVKTLEVLPPPDGIAASDWLPSKGLALAQRWSQESKDLVVGEPITRSLTITAQGLQGAQLPSLKIGDGDGFKLYPDQPQTEDTVDASGVIGSRTESVAIVPTRPGQLTLPEIRVTWWDTKAGEERETRLDAVTVNVVPAGNPPTAPADAAPPLIGDAVVAPGTAPLWLWSLALSNLIFALLTAVFALLWWQRRPGARPAAADRPADNRAGEEQAAFAAIRACPADRLAELRAAILHWARIFWSDRQLKTLGDVVTLSGQAELTRHFASLDGQLYGGGRPGTSADPNPAIEPATIIDLLDRARRQRSPLDGDALPPLYPGG